MSPLCLGSWLTFEFMERDVALAVLRRAAEGGINFFDDARYDDHTGRAPVRSGWSEVVFGELFAESGLSRDEIVMADKLWFEFPDETVEDELDGSLERLDMDWMDLVYCAVPDATLPLEELIPALDLLIGKGKLRAWGVLNWSPGLIEEASRFAATEGLAGPVAAQLPHNLIDRGFVEGPEATRVLAGTGVAVVASHCLAGGLLTGKYNRPGNGGRLGAERIARLADRGVLDRIDRWSALAAGHGATPAQLALAFSLSRPAVAAACFGATTVAQLEEDLLAASLVGDLAAAIAELEADTGVPEDPELD